MSYYVYLFIYIVYILSIYCWLVNLLIGLETVGFFYLIAFLLDYAGIAQARKWNSNTADGQKSQGDGPQAQTGRG